MSTLAFTALARFGLGARPGDLDLVARDPRAWVSAQLARPHAMPRPLSALGTGQQAAAEFTRIVRRGAAAVEQNIRQGARQTYIEEAGLRTQAQVESDQPVHERLVAFWSNHFTVSVQRPVVLSLAGPFEREAIRPHVTGRFRDMLLAVARHSAMLVYLDQAQSIGPNSRIGVRRQRGLNENLAREILELHTLGVEGGYGQADVTAFANILTGWSIARDEDQNPGAFMFRPFVHEPGSKILLGRRFEENGEAEGVAALEMLARHPSTSRHIAAKLARHFIADKPPAALVDRLAKAFRDSDGDLGLVTRLLVDSREAWETALTKVKTPNEFVVSALRACAPGFDAMRALGGLRSLGQSPFAAPSPAGWPDTADQWLAPESVMRRAEWAMALATRLGRDRDAQAVLDTALGPAARNETRTWFSRAASSTDALALVIASPEFQRR